MLLQSQTITIPQQKSLWPLQVTVSLHFRWWINEKFISWNHSLLTLLISLPFFVSGISLVCSVLNGVIYHVGPLPKELWHLPGPVDDDMHRSSLAEQEMPQKLFKVITNAWHTRLKLNLFWLHQNYCKLTDALSMRHIFSLSAARGSLSHLPS